MRIKKSLYIITFAVTIFGLFTACKKDSPFPTNPLPNGDVHLHLHSIIDTNININIDSMYFLTSGRKISISKAKLYISNIQLVNTEGDTVNVPGTFLYDNFDSEFNLGELPSAKYNTINFNVGLGPKSNSINPTSDSDILLFPSDMWFDVTPQPLGFTFLNFEGKIDTTTNANGNLVDMKSFSYKIGKMKFTETKKSKVKNDDVKSGGDNNN